jgi:hypothetical protein
MKRGAVLAALLVPGLAAPAWAQESRASRVRLDDFALPQVEAGPAVVQIESEASRIPADPSVPGDRQVSVPGPAIAPREPLSQISPPDPDGITRQLSDPRQSRDVASGSVSSSDDSRPQPSPVLAGKDRCDPQGAADRAECARILERRAADFDAAEPPRLSAEQVLLAQSEKNEDALAAHSSRVRLRLASADDPSADVQSNQELAAIYLRREAADPEQPQAGEPADDAALAEVLEALQVSGAGTSPP